MEEQLGRIATELKKMNDNLLRIAKANETMAESIKNENNNASSFTFKHKMATSFEKLIEAISKRK